MKPDNGQRKFYSILTGGLLLAAIFVLINQTAFAQAGQSELTGTVTDANGATIFAAQVVLTETAARQTAEIQTDENGTFIFTNKKPGLYSIKFMAMNFNTLIREGLTLTTGERIRVDEQLSVATGQETVTVNAAAPLLRSETSASMRRLITGDCFILAASASQWVIKETVTITPRRKASFPDTRRNWLKTASLNQSNKPARKSSAISKAITIESDFIQVWIS
jgi:hypothetical protein